MCAAAAAGSSSRRMVPATIAQACRCADIVLCRGTPSRVSAPSMFGCLVVSLCGLYMLKPCNKGIRCTSGRLSLQLTWGWAVLQIYQQGTAPCALLT